MIQNRTFPRWSAPLVGAIVGGIFGVRGARSAGQFVSPEWILYGAAAGALAGCLIFLLDPPQRAQSETGATQASLFGRVFAVLGLLTALLPFLGFVVAAVAVWLNRSVAGWPRVVSWIGAVLATIVTGVVGVLMALGSAK